MLGNRHFARDIAMAPRNWHPASLWADLRAHLRRDVHSDNGSYNRLQRATYGIVLGILLPLMIATGLAISPGFEPAAPWLVDVLGGRQSARSIHFLTSWALFGFFVIHIAMVLVAGPLRLTWGMIAGGRREEPSE